VARATVWYCQQQDPAFAAAVREAEEAACERIDDVVWTLALADNFPTAKFWLTMQRGGVDPHAASD
jgi:hypothetical protein